MMGLITCLCISCVAGMPTSVPGKNLLTNGGFEQLLGKNGQPPGCRVSPVDARTPARGRFALVGDARTGSQALRIIRTNVHRGYGLTVHIPTLRAEDEPRRFLAVCWVKVIGKPGRGQAPSLQWQAFTPDWTGACHLVRVSEANPYAEGWAKHAVLLELRADTTLKHFRYLVEVARPNHGVLIDDVGFYEVTRWPQSAIDELMRHEHEQAIDPPTDARPPRKGNLLENSSFELGLSRGWSILGILPEQQRHAVTNARAKHGDRAMQLVHPGRGRAMLTYKFVPVRVPRSHTLSAWAWADRPGARVTVRFENGYVPRGGHPHNQRTTAKLAAGQWQRISVTGPTQAGPASAYAIKVSAHAPKDGTVLLDAVQFEEGTLTEYQPARSVEAALWPTAPAGLSHWGEPVRYVVGLYNDGATQTTAALGITTHDFWDRKVGDERIGPRGFPPGLTRIERSHPPEVRGSQRVRLWLRPRESPEDEITLTVVPKPRYGGRHPASRFGQHVRLEPWQLGIAKRLGACWNRLHDVEHCVSWDDTEPEPGKWVWADEKIRHAHEAGIEILGVFGRCPAWASSTGKAGWHYPKDLEAWGRYVEKTARHYRGKIDVWEIWNEPWHHGFGIGDGTKYARLAKIAYTAAKRGNPDSTVIGMCTHELMLAFNRAAVAAGALAHSDSISFHTYSGTGVDAYGRARAIFAMFDPDRTGKPIWMTEGLGGYTFTWHSLLVDAVDDPYSRRPGAPKFTAERAARVGAISLAGILAAGAEKAFWYWSPWENVSSIRPDRYTWFEYDGQLKPHAAAYAVSAHFLDGSRPVRRCGVGSSVFCAFARGSEFTAVCWSETEKPLPHRDIFEEIRGLGDIAAYDLMGNRLTTCDDGLVPGRLLIYFYGPKQPIRKFLSRLIENGRTKT